MKVLRVGDRFISVEGFLTVVREALTCTEVAVDYLRDQPEEVDRHPISQGAADVLSERRRQVNGEDRTSPEDDCYTQGQLAFAGAAYAIFAAGQAEHPTQELSRTLGGIFRIAYAIWPWTEQWWKPKDQRRNLVRAAALIIAEIDRIDRQAARA